MKKFSVFFIIMLCASMVAPIPQGRAQAKAIPASNLAPRLGISQLPVGLEPVYLAAISGEQPWAARGAEMKAEGGGLSAHFSTAGVRLSPAAQDAGWTWGVALEAWGRGETVEAVAAPAVSVEGKQVQYRRGAITEWYLPSAIGIEQGFTIAKAPKGAEALTLRLRLNGELPVAASDERGAIFSTPTGQSLHYDSLRAYDAKGLELNVRMSVASEQVLIELEDGGATYPITVDPLIYLEAQVIASDAATGDSFGASVAVNGDTAVIGAYYKHIGANADQGAVYVFTRNGITWSQQQELTAADGAAYDGFGYSVAVSGDTAVIGALNKTYNYNYEQGVAYVFTRSGTTWSQQQELTAVDGAEGDQFGVSVAVSGDTAVIGAARKGSLMGAAYVFTRSGASWSQQQKLTAADGAAYDYFGESVAFSGDTVVIGAGTKTVGGNIEQGAAYIFTRRGAAWSQQQKLVAADGAAHDYFGTSVAVSGDTAVIGAHSRTVGGNNGQGAAYVFTRSGTSWSQQQELTAVGGAPDDRFGGSVAVSGNTVVIGTSSHDVGVNIHQGVAYVFTRSGATWSQEQELVASDGAAYDRFGVSVAFDGVAVIGAYQKTLDSLSYAGSAYIYYPYNSDTDLMVNQAVSDATPDAGQAVTFTVSVTNLGFRSAFGVALMDRLPGGVTYISSRVTSGVYDPMGGSWNLTSLAVGASATLVLNATVNSGTANQSITNTATLVGYDANLFNNAASVTLVVNGPQVAISPASLTFGATLLWVSSPMQTITVTNSGSAALHFSSIGFTSEFSAAGGGTCSASPLAPGSACTINVRFTPVAVGLRSGALTVSDDAPGSPHVVGLSGVGAVAQIVISPTWLTFGNTKVGTSSSPQTVTVNNTSNFQVAIPWVTFVGPFSRAGGSCELSLAGNRSCTLTVQFSPTVEGLATGQMRVTNDTLVDPLVVNLKGLGARGLLSLTPFVPVFAFEPVGVPAPPVMVTVTNKGKVDVILSGIELNGDFANSGTGTCTTSTTLAPRATCTIGIVFTPSDLGARSGELTIASDAENSPTNLALSGAGAAEIITNGGMETDTAAPPGVPDGWTAAGMTIGDTTDGLDTAIFHSGVKSMRIVGTTGTTKTLSQMITDSGSVGLPLRLIFWVRGTSISASGQFQVIVQLYVGSTAKKTYVFEQATGTYDFTKMTYNLTSPVAFTKIAVQIKSTKGTGSTMWIDDFSLVHP